MPVCRADSIIIKYFDLPSSRRRLGQWLASPDSTCRWCWWGRACRRPGPSFGRRLLPCARIPGGIVASETGPPRLQIENKEILGWWMADYYVDSQIGGLRDEWIFFLMIIDVMILGSLQSTVRCIDGLYFVFNSFIHWWTELRGSPNWWIYLSFVWSSRKKTTVMVLICSFL